MTQIINLRENRHLFDIYYDTITYQHVLYSAQLGIYLGNEQMAKAGMTPMYIHPFSHNHQLYTCKLCNDDLIQETRFELCEMHYNEQRAQQKLNRFQIGPRSLYGKIWISTVDDEEANIVIYDVSPTYVCMRWSPDLHHFYTIDYVLYLEKMRWYNASYFNDICVINNDKCKLQLQWLINSIITIRNKYAEKWWYLAQLVLQLDYTRDLLVAIVRIFIQYENGLEIILV